MNFAEKMIELRRQQNLSQQDLADRLGVSRQAISRWETGAVQPTADSVRGLAQVLQVSTDYLLNDELDDPHPRAPPSPSRHPRRNQSPPASAGNGSWLWLPWWQSPCLCWSRRQARRTISSGKNVSRCLRRMCCRNGMTVNQMDHSTFHGDSRKEVNK